MDDNANFDVSVTELSILTSKDILASFRNIEVEDDAEERNLQKTVLIKCRNVIKKKLEKLLQQGRKQKLRW